MSIYIGIDWSEEQHDVVFLNEAGAVIGQMTMVHSVSGVAIFGKNPALSGGRAR